MVFINPIFIARADAYYQISNPDIDGRVQFSMHFLPDVVDLSMSLVVRAQLEGAFQESPVQLTEIALSSDKKVKNNAAGIYFIEFTGSNGAL